MSKIKEIKLKKNMQSHINDAYQFLEDHLPVTYSQRVVEIMAAQNKDVAVRTITNVRHGINKNRIDVLNALVTVAKEHKAQVEELANKLNFNN